MLQDWDRPPCPGGKASCRDQDAHRATACLPAIPGLHWSGKFEPISGQILRTTKEGSRIWETHVLDVDSCRDNFDVIHRELRALGHDISIHNNHRTTIVVQSITVAALLIGVEIDAPALYWISIMLNKIRQVFFFFTIFVA